MADQVTKDIIVKAGVDDVYAVWANFENFPRFMTYIKSITKTGERTSHWVMEGPLGKDLEWDAETTMLEPNKRIAWNSREGGDIKTSGQVTFNGLAQGQTEITVTLQYVPPAGKLGEFVANLFADPEKRLDEDLRNFKAYVEGSNSRAAAV
ncbi:MAG TPA: SRPBCC family protein [Roseiflexaceae bacterium]|nr:SRPBCC family protein [Roseiflexaceae bacterium]